MGKVGIFVTKESQMNSRLECFRITVLSLLSAFLLAGSANAVPTDPLFAASFFSFDVGLGPGSVAIGDLNGDGKPDLTTACYATNTVSVLLGNGDGTFGARTDFGTGPSPSLVAIGDLSEVGTGRMAPASRWPAGSTSCASKRESSGIC